ncbi:MAG: hypothetical protein EOS41_32305, partial [Mesorhizobium sp.]|uniref:hypothetical protein n=1 Tax=Mesorhizobium sp. TaxID=1871066 RepID=UPI000FE887D3
MAIDPDQAGIAKRAQRRIGPQRLAMRWTRCVDHRIEMHRLELPLATSAQSYGQMVLSVIRGHEAGGNII